MLFIAIALLAGQAQAASIWTAPASQKIRPMATPPAGALPQIALFAAKNEFESFHAVVTGPASAISMSLAGGLSDGLGHSITGTDVVLYREALLNVPTASGGDGAVGLWPDALVPDVDPIVGEKRNAFPFDVASGQSLAVFVDIHVPAAAPAGVYTGSLQVKSAGVAIGSIAISLTVWDFALPSTSTMRSAFGLAWNTPCGGHWGDWSCSNPNAWALRTRYIQAALDNRISIETPVMGQPVDAYGNASWSDYDTHAGPFLNGTANTRLKGARINTVRIQVARQPVTTAQAQAWSTHFRAKGWFGTLFNYACDEPPLTCAWTDIDPRIAAVTAGDPAIPNFVTTSVERAVANGVKNIQVYAPVINFMDDKPDGTYPGNQRPLYGGVVWWYQSCMSYGCGGLGNGYGPGSPAYESGWPTYAVDSDGTRNRSMEWMTFAYGITGEIYFETTNNYTMTDPWTNQTRNGGTGDGTLFYPGKPSKIGGTTDIPIETLRLKGVRDGMEDYELLHLAQTLGLLDQATQIARATFARTFDGVSTAAAIDASRAQLAALILHALGKDPAPDAGTPDAGTTDAGNPGGGGEPDAGTPDAGSPDAGAIDPGTPDAGSVDPGVTDAGSEDAGVAVAGNPPPADAGNSPPVDPPTVHLASAGCSSHGAQPAWLALPLVFMAMGIWRRRRSI